MGRSKRITMKDVAREAGVALGTVSRVVNGNPVGRFQRPGILLFHHRSACGRNGTAVR